MELTRGRMMKSKVYPEIWAKSGIGEEELEHRIRIGADGIELQLLKGDTERIGDESIVEMVCKYPIYAVHVPIVDGEAVRIEDILNPETYADTFLPIFRFANRIGERFGREITIVVHSWMSAEQLTGRAWDDICGTISSLLSAYSHTRVGIENVTPFSDRWDTDFILRNNIYVYDTSMIARKLREYTGSDRAGVIIDTCHMVMTNTFMREWHKLRGTEDLIEDPVREFEEAIAEAGDLLYHFHFNNARRCGLGDDHSVGFVGSESRLEGFLKAYERMECTAPLCLELNEEDYTNCINFIILRGMIHELFEELVTIYDKESGGVTCRVPVEEAARMLGTDTEYVVECCKDNKLVGNRYRIEIAVVK